MKIAGQPSNLNPKLFLVNNNNIFFAKIYQMKNMLKMCWEKVFSKKN